MHLFGVEPNTLHLRGRLGRLGVLVECLGKCHSLDAKCIHQESLLLAVLLCLFISRREIFQLLVERQELPARIRQADAVICQCRFGLISSRAGRRERLVEAHDGRRSRVDIAARELQDTRQLPRLARADA